MKSATWIVLALTAACGPSTPAPDASTDGSIDQTSLDANTTDAPADAVADVAEDAPFDAGPCSLSFVDGGTCNALTATGAQVLPQCHNATPPTPVGGPIYNGRYVLTKIDYYNALSCPTQAEQIDWAICGSEWETVQLGASQTVRVNATASPSGSSLSLALTCPNTGNSSWQYDATSTSLVFYMTQGIVDGGASVRADTYTKM